MELILPLDVTSFLLCAGPNVSTLHPEFGPDFVYTGCAHWGEKKKDGLAGVLADNPAGGGGGGDSHSRGVADCILDDLFALAMEVSGRGGSCASHCAASHGVGVLCVGGAGVAESFGTLVAGADRTHAGVYFHGAGNRFHCL